MGKSRPPRHVQVSSTCVKHLYQVKRAEPKSCVREACQGNVRESPVKGMLHVSILHALILDVSKRSRGAENTRHERTRDITAALTATMARARRVYTPPNCMLTPPNCLGARCGMADTPLAQRSLVLPCPQTSADANPYLHLLLGADVVAVPLQ